MTRGYQVETMDRDGNWSGDMGPDNWFSNSAEAEEAIQSVLAMGGEWVSYEDEDGVERLCEYRVVELL